MASDPEVARIASALAEFIRAVDKVEVRDVKQTNDVTLATPGKQRQPAEVWGLHLGMTILDIKNLIAEGRYHSFIPKE